MKLWRIACVNVGLLSHLLLAYKLIYKNQIRHEIGRASYEAEMDDDVVDSLKLMSGDVNIMKSFQISRGADCTEKCFESGVYVGCLQALECKSKYLELPLWQKNPAIYQYMNQAQVCSPKPNATLYMDSFIIQICTSLQHKKCYKNIGTNYQCQLIHSCFIHNAF